MKTAKRIDIGKLKPNEGQLSELGLPRNPRFIKDEKFEKLIKSLKENPEMLELRELIVYEDRGGQLVVICGNMRYRAAKVLGMKTLPCKILPPETDVEKLKKYAIIDNSEFGQYDWNMVYDEWDMEELEDWGVDFPPMQEGPAQSIDGNEQLDMNNMDDKIKLTFTLDIDENAFVMQTLQKIDANKEKALLTLMNYNADENEEEYCDISL